MLDTLSQNQINKAVGEKLRQFRVVRGISQSRLADSIGRSFQQVQKYEKGKNRISLGVLVEIAAFLNVTPADFFNDFTHMPSEAQIESEREVLELVRSYHGLSQKDRNTLRMIARNMIPACTQAAE